MPAPASFERSLARVERERPPQDLVENRTTFGAEAAEFTVFDTFAPAERVPLQADNPLYCGMVTGKKVVHTVGGDAIPFLPEESLVVPSGQTIHIDFPGASEAEPTKCLTIEIDRARVARLVDRLNEAAPRMAESGPWTYADVSVCHFPSSQGIQETVRQLVHLFVEGHPDRALLIDFGVQDLVVRMLRVEARRLLLEESAVRATGHGISAAIEFARARLHEPLTVADLASVACMSEASFYRAFRVELGQTPLGYLTELRISRARTLLMDRRRSVGDVAFAVGFSSTSHFIRVFRAHEGLTPKQYQLRTSVAEA